MNISSKSLFHYTRNIDSLKNILTNGFEYRRLTEPIPCLKKDVLHVNFSSNESDFSHLAVCFCDIPLSVAKDHINQYGDYCIGLKKSWAIANGVTPIRYVHDKTPDITNNILFLVNEKSRDLKLRNETISENLLKELIKEGVVDQRECLNSIQNAPKWCLELIKRYESIYTDFQNQILRQTAYLRVYEGPWKNRKNNTFENRAFYNEKEWRAVAHNASPSHLKFNFDDISKIIVKQEEDIDIIVDLLEKNIDNLDGSMERNLLRRIFTHEDIFHDI